MRRNAIPSLIAVTLWLGCAGPSEQGQSIPRTAVEQEVGRRTAHAGPNEPMRAQAPGQVMPVASGPKCHFSVRFEPGKALEYRFVSSRRIEIHWYRSKAATDPNDKGITHMSESLEMNVVYTPEEVESNGVTTIQALVKSVRVQRTADTDTITVNHGDPAEAIRGRTFRFKVDPLGKVADVNTLDALLKEVGAKTFREDPRNGRIKDPEMIADIWATQWFLWDAVSGMDANGVAVGQTWTSRLSVPTPMVMRKARDVVYRLESVDPTDSGRVGVIGSRFVLSPEKAPTSWPIPYSGKMRPSGTFGFLGGYTPVKLEGQGQERFNLDAGRTEGYMHRYHAEIQAVVPLMMSRANILIDQKISMELCSAQIGDGPRR